MHLAMAPKAVKATLAELTAHAAELKSLERDLKREVKKATAKGKTCQQILF